MPQAYLATYLLSLILLVISSYASYRAKIQDQVASISSNSTLYTDQVIFYIGNVNLLYVRYIATSARGYVPDILYRSTYILSAFRIYRSPIIGKLASTSTTTILTIRKYPTTTYLPTLYTRLSTLSILAVLAYVYIEDIQSTTSTTTALNSLRNTNSESPYSRFSAIATYSPFVIVRVVYSQQRSRESIIRLRILTLIIDSTSSPLTLIGLSID